MVSTLKDSDVYVGVGLASRDYGPAHRCGSDEIAGITGFWADFDLRSDAHNKKALPPTIADALSVIPATMPPTIAVATGNGAHAWWLFKEPLVFDSDQERKDTARLVTRWQTLLRVRTSQRGWVFDRLSDLARVLRIPGTSNLKDPKNPKAVTVQCCTNRRYNPSDFEEFLDEAGIPDPEAEQQAAREWAERFRDKPLVINPNATVPQELLDGLAAADPRFKSTWLRERHDLKDQSQSGYDLALANFGCDAGFCEQQITDLIIHHRRIHNQRPRTRLDYFQRTIGKAFRRSGGVASPNLPDQEEQVRPSTVSPDTQSASAGEQSDPATAKALLCEQISKVLGVRVIRLVKITGKEPSYQMQLENNKIEFSHVGKLIDQRSLRLGIASAVDLLIPKIKPKAWEQLAQMTLDALFEKAALETLLAAFEGDYRRLLDWWRRNIAPRFHSRIQFPVGVAWVRGPQALAQKPKVIVGTIHSVKGGEADVVFLFPDLSRAGDVAYQRFGPLRDSVIRLFYVGMTRARETLYICQRESALAVCI
ncbi:MAG: hypothetical protein A3H28_02550 [Acidobacteria bacterium RIFCSPLOWO2_02_FULL_61_28]|nr:MAG: hypothetical protein A3H28_02550 [Acidobacteria bacterium RIFCSPLOWO2_02_FULL_61_28]